MYRPLQRPLGGAGHPPRPRAARTPEPLEAATQSLSRPLQPWAACRPPQVSCPPGTRRMRFRSRGIPDCFMFYFVHPCRNQAMQGATAAADRRSSARQAGQPKAAVHRCSKGGVAEGQRRARRLGYCVGYTKIRRLKPFNMADRSMAVHDSGGRAGKAAQGLRKGSNPP